MTTVPAECATALEKEWGDRHDKKFPEWVKEHLKAKSFRTKEEHEYIDTVLTNNIFRNHFTELDYGLVKKNSKTNRSKPDCLLPGRLTF